MCIFIPGVISTDRMENGPADLLEGRNCCARVILFLPVMYIYTVYTHVRKIYIYFDLYTREWYRNIEKSENTERHTHTRAKLAHWARFPFILYIYLASSTKAAASLLCRRCKWDLVVTRNEVNYIFVDVFNSQTISAFNCKYKDIFAGQHPPTPSHSPYFPRIPFASIIRNTNMVGDIESFARIHTTVHYSPRGVGGQPVRPAAGRAANGLGRDKQLLSLLSRRQSHLVAREDPPPPLLHSTWSHVWG